MNLHKDESWRNWLFFALSLKKTNRNRLLRKSEVRSPKTEDRRLLPEPGSLSSCSLSPKDRRERIEGKQSKGEDQSPKTEDHSLRSRCLKRHCGELHRRSLPVRRSPSDIFIAYKPDKQCLQSQKITLLFPEFPVRRRCRSFQFA